MLLTPAFLATATAGSDLLSRQVLESLGWRVEQCGCPSGGRGDLRPEPGLWRKPDGEYHFGPLPAVSETAEAARTLIPPAFEVSAGREPDGRWRIALHAEGEGLPVVSVIGPTLALALCAAAVAGQAQTFGSSTEQSAPTRHSEY